MPRANCRRFTGGSKVQSFKVQGRTLIHPLKPFQPFNRFTRLQSLKTLLWFKSSMVQGSTRFRDRRAYLHWVLEATRFGVLVLDYTGTSNHIHLLIEDSGPNVIAESMRLPAHKLKIQEFTNRGKIVAIARDKVSADSPRRERDEDVKMNLSGFVDIKSLRGNKPVDDLSRLNPVSLSRSDDTEVFR